MTMSKLNIRVILALLISLAVIFAIYTTVQSASLNSTVDKLGAHSVSGVMTNFNHDRFTVAEQESLQTEMESLNNYKSGSGHGCESESLNSPLD